VLLSGKEGKFLQKVATPHEEETYYAPQVLIYLDGVSIVVFGTGGQASPGGLYAVSLHQLVKGNMLEVRHVEIYCKPEYIIPCVATLQNKSRV
jgi:predicted TPR repeat methyltransferase